MNVERLWKIAKPDTAPSCAEELLLATGCTEPIAVAYCAAKLREVLGGKPEKVLAEISGNILKNVKSVVVPNTGGPPGHRRRHRRGHSGRRRRTRSCRSSANVTEEDTAAHPGLSGPARPSPITCPETPCLLDIRLTGWLGGHKRRDVRVANNHTNLVYMARDGQVLQEQPGDRATPRTNLQDKTVLNVKDILTFAETVPIDAHTAPVSAGRSRSNTAIAAEGLRGELGRQHRLHPALQRQRRTRATQARAWAAAGLRRPHERLRDAGGHRAPAPATRASPPPYPCGNTGS